MLIIEGCDGVGKTTLAKKLVAALPTHVYAHFTRLPWRFDRYWGYIERMSPNIVQDRYHMSEIAYAQARGDLEILLDDDMYRLIDAQLRLIGGYTVLVLASQDLIERRWTPDQMFDLEKTLKAGQIYDQMSDSGKYDIDYSFHCSEAHSYVTDDAIAEILHQYRERQFVIESLARRKPLMLKA